MKASQFGAVLSTAALLAAISAPAFAEDNVTTVTQTTSSTESGASGVQVIDPSATLAGNVLQAAAGNIGANIASGIGNQQANVTRINSNGNENDVTTTQRLGNLSGVSVHGQTVTTGTVSNDSHYKVFSNVGNNTVTRNNTATGAYTSYNNTQTEVKDGYSLNVSGNAALNTSNTSSHANQNGSDSTAVGHLTLGRQLGEQHSIVDQTTTTYNYNNSNTDGTSGNGNGSGNYVYGYHNTNSGNLANGMGNGSGSGSFGYNYTLSETDTSNGNGTKVHTINATGTNSETAGANFTLDAGLSKRNSSFNNTQNSTTFAANGYLNLGAAQDKTHSSTFANQNGFNNSTVSSNVENFSHTQNLTNANVYDDRVVHYFQSDGGATAGIGDNVGQGAAGNIGLNVAAGAFNNQANVAVISAASCSCGASSGAVVVNQSIGSVSDLSTFNTTAYASGNALQNAAGNIGLNIASGIGNQQSNTLSLQP